MNLISAVDIGAFRLLVFSWVRSGSIFQGIFPFYLKSNLLAKIFKNGPLLPLLISERAVVMSLLPL